MIRQPDDTTGIIIVRAVRDTTHLLQDSHEAQSPRLGARPTCAHSSPACRRVIPVSPSRTVSGIEWPTRLRGPRPQIPVPLGLELPVQGCTKATKGAPKAVSFQPMIAPKPSRPSERSKEDSVGVGISVVGVGVVTASVPSRHRPYLGLSPPGLAISSLSYRDPSVGTRGSISCFDSSIIQLYLQCSKSKPPLPATAYTISSYVLPHLQSDVLIYRPALPDNPDLQCCMHPPRRQTRRRVG